MTKYESVLIARQDLGASQVSSIVEDLSNVIKKEGGETDQLFDVLSKRLHFKFCASNLL